MSLGTGTFAVKGLAELQARFAKTSKAMQETIDNHAIATCNAIMQEAQRRVPVVSGHLRSSAWTRVKGRSKSTGTVNVGCGYDAPHAIFVHEIPYKGTTTKGLQGALRNGKGYKWLEKSAKAMTRNAVNLLRAGISETLSTGKAVQWNVPAIDKGGRAGFAASKRGPAMAGVYNVGRIAANSRRAKRSVRGGGGNPTQAFDWLKQLTEKGSAK